MELVKASATILQITSNPLELIELSGRCCYKSEDKITPDSAQKFAKMLLNLGHESVIEHAVATVKFVCDRGITHEIVRHRIASYSQESTRYCNYGKLGVKFVIPSDFELDASDKLLLAMIEQHYNHCLGVGRTLQQARYFLPNGLKTEIIMTCNLREWIHFFKLRTSKKAHPDMWAITRPLLEKFKKAIPVIFDDILVDI